MTVSSLLRRNVASMPTVICIFLFTLVLVSACNVGTVFNLDCPDPIEVGASGRIDVQLSANETLFTVSEPGGAVDVDDVVQPGIEFSTGFVIVDGVTVGSAVVVVTEILSNGMQYGVPLECTIEVVESAATDCTGANAQAGIGDDCVTDADCNECQVCLMAESVPSSTCAPQIPCETSLDCQAFSATSQIYDVNFCGDDGFCR